MPLKLYIGSMLIKINYKTLQGLYIYKYNDKKFFYIQYASPPSSPNCFEITEMCNCYYDNICVDIPSNYLDTYYNNWIFYINNNGDIYIVYSCINNRPFILNITKKCSSCCDCKDYINTRSDTNVCIKKGVYISDCNLSLDPSLIFIDSVSQYKTAFGYYNVGLYGLSGTCEYIDICLNGYNIVNSCLSNLTPNWYYFNDEKIWEVEICKNTKKPLTVNIPECPDPN